MAFEATSALPPVAPQRRALAGFVRDVLGYGAASALALAVDWGSLVVLTQVFAVQYLVAAAVSFSAGLVVAYLLATKLVFRGRARYKAGGELAGFLLTGLAGLVLNQVLLFVFVDFAHAPVAAAKAPTAIFVFSFNFLSRRFLLFSASRT